MIQFQDEHGLVFWPARDVATLTPEYRNRWQAVMRDGSVAFRPTPPPPGTPLLNPAHLTKIDQHWKDPAGFLHPYQPLATIPPPEEKPPIPGVPCARQQIYSLTQTDQDAPVIWHTDLGDFPASGTKTNQVAKAMPELVRIDDRRLFINPDRLRRLERKDDWVYLILDNGVQYTRVKQKGPWSRALGLTSVSYLEPYCSTLWGQRQMRDWPFDLTLASGELLRAHFPTSRRLCANAIWQQFRYLQLGIPQQVADSHRDLWYKVAPMLYRAGFLKRTLAAEQTTKKGLQMTLEFVLSTMIGAGLFTYKELGFRDLHPEWRRIGTRHPEIVIVTEKHSLAPDALRLAEEFGVSLMIMEGNSTLIGAEHFRDAYLQVSTAPICVIAFVDYETLGWLIARAAEDHLNFYGLPSSRPLRYLVTGDTFSPEEKRLYARPLPTKGKGLAVKNQKWLKESGGVDGKEMGIYSNHVQPYDRLRELFQRLLES